LSSPSSRTRGRCLAVATNGWGRQAKLVAGGLPSRQLTQDRRALEKKTQDRSRGILSAVSRPGVEDMGRHEGCRPQYWLFMLFFPHILPWTSLSDSNLDLQQLPLRCEVTGVYRSFLCKCLRAKTAPGRMLTTQLEFVS
jgi:hypothetical protein